MFLQKIAVTITKIAARFLPDTPILALKLCYRMAEELEATHQAELRQRDLDAVSHHESPNTQQGDPRNHAKNSN